MPVFKNHTACEIIRGMKAFFKLEVGVTRTGRLNPGPTSLEGEIDGDEPYVRPDNLVWIVGSGRSGSTWLMRMMGALKRYSVWSEPMLGELFGTFYDNAREDQIPSKQFILGEPFRGSWLRSIRSFVLEGARVRYPQLNPRRYLIIKESTASKGAPLLAEALPESRIIFLVRDPRDIIASNLDAARGGSWMHQIIGNSKQARIADIVDQQPDLFFESAAETLMGNVMGAKRAYEAHSGPKAQLRYEDLRADTLGTMRRIYKTLKLPADDEQLARTVEQHSWENIPEDQKGEGKFFRKGTPEGWREDLTPEQVEIVEQITAPILDEFYSK